MIKAELAITRLLLYYVMKKVLISLSLGMLLLVACNGEKREIKRVATAYLQAMGDYQKADAAPFATKETQEQTLKVVMESVMPYVDTNYINSNRPSKITIKSIEMVSDTEAVVLFHKSTPITEVDGDLQMRKRLDGWRAHVLL